MFFLLDQKYQSFFERSCLESDSQAMPRSCGHGDPRLSLYTGETGKVSVFFHAVFCELRALPSFVCADQESWPAASSESPTTSTRRV